MIGILAGMGPRSTAPFIEQVVSECQHQYGAKYDIDFPPMMIYSLPTPFYIDRPIDHSALQMAISIGLHTLEQTGVSFIAMPCNSAHVYFYALASCLQVPLLNMVEETLKAIPAGSKKVSLLATRMTAESGLYQKPLYQAGLEVIEDANWQSRVDNLILAIKASSEQAGTLWETLMADIQHAGVDTVLLACTDLNAVRHKTPTLAGVLDATECLARATVKRWLEQVKKQ